MAHVIVIAKTRTRTRLDCNMHVQLVSFVAMIEFFLVGSIFLIPMQTFLLVVDPRQLVLAQTLQIINYIIDLVDKANHIHLIT